MDLLRPDDLHDLLRSDGGLRVSLSMPTHRAGAETRQDPIRLKNLLKEAAERLTAAGLRDSDIADILKPAQVLVDDAAFWQHQGNGLALFMAPSEFRSFRLPQDLPELVVVNRRFHVKPLIPLLAADGRFYVLAVSQNETRLLVGSRQSVRVLQLDSIPRSIADALKFEQPEKQLQWHSGTPSPGRGVGARAGAQRFRRRAAVFHGHGGLEDETKDRVLRYFRQIDAGLHDVLRDEHAPLVLAAVDHYLPIYREANTYPHLLDEVITGNPERLRPEALHDLAWSLLEPRFTNEQRRAAERCEQAIAKGLGTTDLVEVVRAAMQGRVDTLFLVQERARWGRIDDAGAVVTTLEPGATDEDLFDRAASDTLRNGGCVHIVPADEMPAGGEIAAILRG